MQSDFRRLHHKPQDVSPVPQVQKEAGAFRPTVQVLSLLVQLSVLWTQGPLHKHVYLPALCDEPALGVLSQTKSNNAKLPGQSVGEFCVVLQSFGLMLVFLDIFFLPHGEVTGA